MIGISHTLIPSTIIGKYVMIKTIHVLVVSFPCQPCYILNIWARGLFSLYSTRDRSCCMSSTSWHSAHLGTVLRASSIYSRPSLVGRHIGTTYVTWSAVDKMADVNTPVHSAHLGTFGSPRKFPFRALTSHSAHLGSFRSVHEARSRLQFRGVPNARRSSCRHIWSADTVASVKQIL